TTEVDHISRIRRGAGDAAGLQLLDLFGYHLRLGGLAFFLQPFAEFFQLGDELLLSLYEFLLGLLLGFLGLFEDFLSFLGDLTAGLLVLLNEFLGLSGQVFIRPRGRDHDQEQAGSEQTAQVHGILTQYWVNGEDSAPSFPDSRPSWSRFR